MKKRAYDNSGRAAQQSETRARIIDVMVAAMADGADDVSVAEIARAAGVSLRTVYQHFPDKAARIDAIADWLGERAQSDVALPQTVADLPDFVASTVDYVLDNETMIRAQMHPGLARAVRLRRKEPQLQALRAVFSANPEGDRLAALIVATLRAETIFDLRDVHRLSRADITSGLTDMVNGLVGK